jgi:hypothetical protein
LGEPKEALPLAQNAVRQVPGNFVYANTLGLAHYRAGQYGDAVKVLESNRKKAEDRYLALGLYILAMSYQRLGQGALARTYYDWAVRWERGPFGLGVENVRELNAFRAEAEAVLAKPPGP